MYIAICNCNMVKKKGSTEAGLSQTDFLDVTLDLNSKFQPYRKPDDTPL